ncbi:MAG: DUF1361 domain-containing protein [Chloroflexi bacterium HGW-Chloroflexi-1]|nr:MAG: DUF1361 domain-containing protein [Chloroflexi bacterium HGW-Chloroflexi-1]
MIDKDRTTWTAIRLLIISGMPVALLAARMVYTGEPTYVFLLWNLALAWLPLILAYLATQPGGRFRLASVLWLPAWLLFLPNAPYIITDIIHLRERQGVPVLYDAVLLFAFAMCGLALGFVSLRWVQAQVARWAGPWWSRFFVLVMLCLTGFGVYLGRFRRWNSWDVLADPAALLGDILARLLHPLHHWRAWGVTGLFAVLLIFLYWLFIVVAEEGVGGQRKVSSQ